MKSPRCESSSSPIDVSREIGSWFDLHDLAAPSRPQVIRSPISGGRLATQLLHQRPAGAGELLMVSIMCTGMRMVRAWSAMAG